ncbi:MAG TPA: hypothetical protein VF516_30055 [Kofleriaceae bacterium]
MTTTRFALAIALAGCGRVGFSEIAGPSGSDAGADSATAADGATGDTVTLVVTSDEYLNEPAGLPIAGATVLVERSTGTDRMVTDATGRAQFAAAGVIACHVIYQSTIGWRGYTVQPPPAGTIELGSRPAFNQNHGMTFALPSNATASDYTVRLPEHCASPPYSGSPSVQFNYAPACEGATIHAVGFVRTQVGSGLPDLYLDAGMVTLRNGATQQVTGSYQQLPTRTLQLTDLPSGATSVAAGVVARAGLDLTPLSPSIDSFTPSGGAVTVQEEVAPGGNTLGIGASGGLPPQYITSSELLAPLSSATAATFSAKDMLPLFESMTITDPTQISWTGAAGGTITIVEHVGGDFQWDWYLPPSATVARLPAIPPDLGVPAPQVPPDASVTKLAVPGAAGGDLVPTIDRRWPAWPHDALLLPAAGGAWTQILYSAAIGPP